MGEREREEFLPLDSMRREMSQRFSFKHRQATREREKNLPLIEERGKGRA